MILLIIMRKEIFLYIKNIIILILVSLLSGSICTSRIETGKEDNNVIFNDISTG